MKTSEIIDGLEDLIQDRESFATPANDKFYGEDNPFRYDIEVLQAAIDKLRRAELENKARTMTFPCLIGDTIYEVEEGLPITSYRVTGFVLGKTEFEDEDDAERRQGWQVEYGKFGIDCECPVNEFGKSLFLTREAAEKVLYARKPEGSETP